MCRLDRLETEDSLLDDDDEWLDDAMALSDFSLHSVNIVLGFLLSKFSFCLTYLLERFDL